MTERKAQTEEELHREHLARLKQITALEAAGINPFPAEPPKLTHKNGELIRRYDELEGIEASIVGRIQWFRGHGGILFIPVEDETDSIQIVATRKNLGDSNFSVVKNCFSRGDFIGATGTLRKTEKGEISVWANEVTMLAKALRVAPFRLSDSEIQQRQRYLHTLSDVEARQKFRVRSQIVQQMREYFIGKLGCLEVETPILDSTYGGAAAKPFTTHHNALNQDFFLRIANELYLKRMTVGGYYEGVFEFSRDFRNEGMDRTHNPEFTQVELYKPWWDYYNMMDMTEEVISGVVERIHRDTKVLFNGQLIDYSKPWRRLTIYDGIRQKLGVNPEDATLEELQRTGRQWGLQIEGTMKGAVCLELFEQLWENELIQPTFVMDFPADTSALTKRHRKNPELTERFELFVGGLEVANCYTELNDPRDQRARFELEMRKKQEGDVEAMPYDEDFIRALEYGMPPQAGIGISIDRWTMLLTDTDHIRQAIYFPTLRRVRDNNG